MLLPTGRANIDFLEVIPIKYILKNIRLFATKNTLVFILFLVSLFVSVTVLLAAYGIYTEYHEKSDRDIQGTLGLYDSQGNKLEESDLEYLLFQQGFDKYYERPMKFEECRGFFYDLGTIFGDKLDYIDFTCLPEHINEMELLNNVDIEEGYVPFISIISAYKDDKVVPSTVSADIVKLGRNFTDKEFETNAKVCIVGMEELQKHNHEYMDLTEENGTYYVTTNGVKYEVVGYLNPEAMCVVIPPSVAPGNCYVGSGFDIKLNDVPTAEEYREFTELVSYYFADLITEVTEMPVANIDTEYFYNTNIWISVIIALAAAINLAVLYQYVLVSRRKTLAIFRLVGATKNRIRRLYILETTLISSVMFVISTVIFNVAIKPFIIEVYPYIENLYTLKVYAIMFLIYMAVTVVILNIMIMRYVSKAPVNLMKEEN